MQFAIIEDNAVINVAVADEPLADNWIASDIASIGDTYESGKFIRPKPDLAAEADAVRTERNAKLAASDWTQVADAPVDKAAWATYRQALRDITSQAGFPFDVQWPQEP